MRRFFALFLFLLAGNAMSFTVDSEPTLAFHEPRPEITSIRKRNVHVSVPEGYDKVWIEVLTRATTGKRKKALPPIWKVQEEKFTRGEASRLTFKLKTLTPRKNVRVFGTRQEALPPALQPEPEPILIPDTSEVSGFAEAPPGFPDEVQKSPYYAFNSRIIVSFGNANTSSILHTSTLSLDSGSSLNASAVASTDTLAATENREVSESDIWHLEGDRLYYFNGLRGLQVFDLTDDSNPALMGTLRMPGVGQNMYMLDSEHVALLKCGRSWNGLVLTVIGYQPPRDVNSELVVASVGNGVPKALGSIEFEGAIRESRLVGNVLYVAVDTYVGNYWLNYREKTKVLSFDLSHPEHPVKKDEVIVEGYGNVISATSRFLFVAAWDYSSWGHSLVTAVDISNPNGIMKMAGVLRVEGRIPDKFKMNLDGDVFTVVSSYRKDRSTPPPEALEAQANGQLIWWDRNVSVSRVSTFQLSNQGESSALGVLDLAEGEQLHATRFDGKRLYMVTALHRPTWGILQAPLPGIIDPLWIVDLSNPSELRAVGELIIPGFSTYIHPMGDRLVSIGLVDNQPTVSLFDVSNPADPLQLTRLQLGAGYSEAVRDEKAFSVLPDQGLILMPLSGPNPEGFVNRVQLIDLNRDSLVKRGEIGGGFSPRRASVHGESLVAISSTRLVTADASDRDHPIVKADLEIAWPVDRVFHMGEYLVQITGGNWSNAASITVSPVSNPDETLSVTPLKPMGVAGAEVKGGVLHLLQSNDQVWTYDSTTRVSTPTESQQLFSCFDLTQLPVLKKLGEVATSNSHIPTATALWPSETTLVWASQRDEGWWDYSYGWNCFGRSGDYHYRRSLDLCAFDVSDPNNPRFLSRIYPGKNEPWRCGKPLVANGRIMIGYRYQGENIITFGGVLTPVALNTVYTMIRNPTQMAFGKCYVLEVDYAHPEKPEIGKPINLPGELIGLSHNGGVLYTSGYGYEEGLKVKKTTYALHASIYNGAEATLIDQIPLKVAWQPAVQAGDTLFVLDATPAYIPQILDTGGSSFELMTTTSNLVAGDGVRVNGLYLKGVEENPEKSALQTWRLQDSGEFLKLAELKYVHESSISLVNDLAILGNGDTTFRVLNVADPIAIGDFGVFKNSGINEPDFQHAVGDSANGLWIPQGEYGVEYVPAKQNSSD